MIQAFGGALDTSGKGVGGPLDQRGTRISSEIAPAPSTNPRAGTYNDGPIEPSLPPPASSRFEKNVILFGLGKHIGEHRDTPSYACPQAPSYRLSLRSSRYCPAADSGSGTHFGPRNEPFADPCRP